MDPQVVTLLRRGLLFKEGGDRQPFLRKIQDLPLELNKDKIKAEAALKDNSTTIDDLDYIMDGHHYENWIKNNIKEELIPIQNNLDSNTTTSNMNLLHRNDKLRSDLEDIMDYIPIDHKIKIETNPADVLIFIRNGEQFSYGTIPNTVANDKVALVLDQFENKLSLKDKQFFISQIKNCFENIQNVERGLLTLEEFVKALNSQLDEKERIRALALLSKKSI